MGPEVEGNHMDVEGAIKETEERAKELLFDAKGKRRDIRTVIGLWVFQVVLRMDDIHIAPGEVFDWQGTTLRYAQAAGMSRPKAKASYLKSRLCWLSCAASRMASAKARQRDWVAYRPDSL